MTNSRGSYLLKNTLIFTLGNLATKLITFVLIPLYTNILSTNEYGIIDAVVTICTIVVPIITLNISEAVLRFNMDKGVNSNKITKIGILILFFGSIFGLLLIPFCKQFKEISDIALLIYFYVISFASCQIFLSDLRGKELLVKYSFGNIINTVLIALFSIVLLKIYKLGVNGYLLAYSVSYFITAIYALLVGDGYKSITENIDFIKIKEMLKYSVVLIPNSFMWWIMNSSDHIMVTSMIGAAANGIYAISYKFPNLISTFASIFNQAWQYSAIREEGSIDEESYYNSTLERIIVIAMLIGLGILTFIKPFLKIYVASDYYDAWKYTPFLIVGCIFMTIGTFMSTSYTVHKDSMGFLISGTVGALLNVVLNYLLIPLLGVFGAAISTCSSYIVVFIFRVFHTRKYIHYHILTKGFVVGLIALIVSSHMVFINGVIGQILQTIVFVIVLIIFKDSWFSIIGTFKNLVIELVSKNRV